MTLVDSLLAMGVGFLRDASERFNLFAFTASESFYSNPLLNALDPKDKIFSSDRRFSRADCTQLAHNSFTKDLCRVRARGSAGAGAGGADGGQAAEDRWFSRTVLVDNNPFSFLKQPKNGIPVVSWYESVHDTALEKVLEFLDSVDNLADVRPFLDATFHVESTLERFKQMHSQLAFGGAAAAPTTQ